MRIEAHQGGYRMVPSTSATSPVVRAYEQGRQTALPCEDGATPVRPRDADRIELTSLPIAAAMREVSRADLVQQRLRERLVAGQVDGPIDLAGPAGPNRVLNRAYFLSEQSVAERNISAVGRRLDVHG